MNTFLAILTCANENSRNTLSRLFSDTNQRLDVVNGLTPGALTKARERIRWEYFKHLADRAVEARMRSPKLSTWHGMLLKALDGSEFVVPKQAYMEFLDETIASQERYIPQAHREPEQYKLRVSQVYDPLNRITFALDINLKDQGEKPFTLKQRPVFGLNDLVLADRGYEALYLFAFFKLVCNSDFVIRACVRSGGIVKDFVDSGEKERIVTQRISSADSMKLQQAGHSIEAGTELRLRYIRVELDNGEVEVLVTSLTDNEAYPAEEFKELYHMRWGVEESYKIYKCMIAIEKWLGRKLDFIRQELYLAQFVVNIVEALGAELPLSKKETGRKYDYQRNAASLLQFFRRTVAKLMCSLVELGTWLGKFRAEAINSASVIRPGRRRVMT